MEFAPIWGMSPGRVVVGPPLCTLVVVGRTTVVDGIDVVVGPPMSTMVVVGGGVVGGYAWATSGAARMIDTIAPKPTTSARRVDAMLRRSSRRRSSRLMSTESNGRRPQVKCPDQHFDPLETDAADKCDHLRLWPRTP